MDVNAFTRVLIDDMRSHGDQVTTGPMAALAAATLSPGSGAHLSQHLAGTDD